MSLNIGTEACEALRSLHTHDDSRPHLDKVRAGLLEQARKFMNAALDGPAVDRHTNLGYARAMRDMVVAFESAATGVQQVRVQQPGPHEGGKHATR